MACEDAIRASAASNLLRRTRGATESGLLAAKRSPASIRISVGHLGVIPGVLHVSTSDGGGWP